jgi:hypothetical protein
MSERPSRTYMSPSPEHIHVIAREPMVHIVSMYFHCKESEDHASGAHFMPSLDDLLDVWRVNAISNQTKKVQDNNRFHCYNPTNHPGTE